MFKNVVRIVTIFSFIFLLLLFGTIEPLFRESEFEIERTDTLLVDLEFEFEQRVLLNKLFFISGQHFNIGIEIKLFVWR